LEDTEEARASWSSTSRALQRETGELQLASFVADSPHLFVLFKIGFPNGGSQQESERVTE
jgi:hypothetical protein